VETAGDLLVNTVTDEESTGAGTAAVVSRGLPADAAVIPEPTGLDLWTGSRGAGIATITVPGRAGHAGLAREEGDPAPAVNAIDATVPVLRALHRLRDDWRSDAALSHPLLGTGDIVPISIEAGDWLVTHPSSCRLRCHVSFTPSQADDRGLGGPVRDELDERVAAAAAQDPWLRENPPRVEWSAGVPTAEVPADHPIVETLRRAAADLGRTSRLSSRTTWYDGVTLTRSGIPTVACGPGDIAQAHAVDEFVPVDDLVATAQCLALTALRFCGPSRRA
jgi:acetylornithine deacetylase